MLEREHFTVDSQERRIRLFQTEGHILPSGFCEVKVSDDDGWQPVGTLPSKATVLLVGDCLKEVESLLEKPTTVRLNPLAAVRLFLEEYLCEADFLNPQVAASWLVLARKASVAPLGVKPRTLSVKIARDAKAAVALLGVQGNVLASR